MPAARYGSSRRREHSRDTVKLVIAQAIRERWTASKLSRETGVSLQVACDELAIASRKIENKADRELGVLASQMREAAQSAVPTVVALQKRCISACERILERLESDIQEFQSIPGKHGDSPASIPLSKAARTLAGAMKELGASVKDLTGLRAAETVAVSKAVAAAKKDPGKVDPWALDFEVIEVQSSD